MKGNSGRAPAGGDARWVCLVALLPLLDATAGYAQQSVGTGAPLPMPGTIRVAGFVLTGNQAIGSSELAPVLLPYVEQDLQLEDLEGAANLITREYRRRGYSLARAYIPEQRIAAGVVEIAVLEGLVGQVEVAGNAYYSSRFIRRGFAGLLGEPLRLSDLERSLLVLGDHPDLAVSAVLQPGRAPGTTDIVAKATDKRPIHLYADYNNFGVPFISRDRVTLGGSVGNALIPGAVADVSVIIGDETQKLFFQVGSYSIPLSGQGTRLVLSGSNGNFDVGGLLAELTITGTLRTYDLSVTHPIIRSRIQNLSIDGGFLSKDNKLFVLDQVIGNDALRMLKLGLSYDRTDPAGRTSLSIYGFQGLGKILGGMADDSPAATRRGADNRFSKANVAVGRVQSLGHGFFMIVRGAGQISGGPLPNIEQMFLGGADSVRGYILGERLGDEGYNVSAELRYSLPFLEQVQVGAFIDNGAARVRNPAFGERGYYSLTGAGPGLRVSLPYFDSNLRLDLGFPIDPPKAITGSLFGGSSPMLYLQLNARL